MAQTKPITKMKVCTLVFGKADLLERFGSSDEDIPTAKNKGRLFKTEKSMSKLFFYTDAYLSSIALVLER